MNNPLAHLPGLDPLHYLLAYMGLGIHIFLKLAETPGPLLESFSKKDTLTTIASAIAIPAILIICSENLNDVLPINYVTAFLAGFQTQSILRSIGAIGGKYMVNKKN